VDAVDEPERSDVTANERAFRVMVRNEAFRMVQLLARRDHETLAEVPGVDGGRWRASAIAAAMTDYWDEYDSVGIDADARQQSLFSWDRASGVVSQIIADPEGHHEWRIEAEVELEQSRDEGRAVLALAHIGRL
jgi:hypothetical protein